MGRKAGQVVVRVVGVDLVEQQERIEHRQRARAERAAQPDARAFDRRLRVDQVGHLARARRPARRGAGRVDPAGGERDGRNADAESLDHVAAIEIVPAARHLEKATTPPGRSNWP